MLKQLQLCVMLIKWKNKIIILFILFLYIIIIRSKEITSGWREQNYWLCKTEILTDDNFTSLKMFCAIFASIQFVQEIYFNKDQLREQD